MIGESSKLSWKTRLPLQSRRLRSGWTDLHLCGYTLWSLLRKECKASGFHCSRRSGRTRHAGFAPPTTVACLSSWRPGCSQSRPRSGTPWPWAGRFRAKQEQERQSVSAITTELLLFALLACPLNSNISLLLSFSLSILVRREVLFCKWDWPQQSHEHIYSGSFGVIYRFCMYEFKTFQLCQLHGNLKRRSCSLLPMFVCINNILYFRNKIKEK